MTSVKSVVSTSEFGINQQIDRIDVKISRIDECGARIHLKIEEIELNGVRIGLSQHRTGLTISGMNRAGSRVGRTGDWMRSGAGVSAIGSRGARLFDTEADRFQRQLGRIRSCSH